MTTHITARASSNHLTSNVNETTNCCSTKANNEDNGGLPETSTRRRNDHQDSRRKAKEVTTPGQTTSSPTNTRLDEAKARHLVNDGRHRVPSKGIA